MCKPTDGGQCSNNELNDNDERRTTIVDVVRRSFVRSFVRSFGATEQRTNEFERTNERTNERMNERTNGRTNERLTFAGQRTNERMDERTNECIAAFVPFTLQQKSQRRPRTLQREASETDGVDAVRCFVRARTLRVCVCVDRRHSSWIAARRLRGCNATQSKVKQSKVRQDAASIERMSALHFLVPGPVRGQDFGYGRANVVQLVGLTCRWQNELMR